MSLQGFIPWLTDGVTWLRENAPAWPLLIGFEGTDVIDPEDEERWREEERRLFPYLYWPNI